MKKEHKLTLALHVLQLSSITTAPVVFEDRNLMSN